MGMISMNNNNPQTIVSQSHYHTHKIFLFLNYILLGASSSCIFLTLSLRLIPSVSGFFLILLHIITILSAIIGCTRKWYGAHMVSTVLTAIFQGSVSVLIFTRTAEFLGSLDSYVKEGDGEVILKIGGGLSVAIFGLEWVVLTLAFFLKYYDCVQDGKSSAKVVHEGEMKDYSWTLQVI